MTKATGTKAAVQQQAEETSLRLNRRFSAPRDVVFRSWTEPEELKKWFGPVGHATVIAEVDLRVGGHYRIGMKKVPDGEVFHVSGTYREVSAPERLVFTWAWEGKEMDPTETLVTVEFRDLGAATEVALTHARFASAEQRDRHVEGWTSSFDKHAALVTSAFQAITHEERDELVRRLEETRRSVAETAAGLTDTQAGHQPAEGRWSVLECVEHLVLSEGHIRSRVEESLAALAVTPRRASASEMEAMLAMVRDRSQKFPAPEWLLPTGQWSTLAATVAKFLEQRDATMAFARATQADLHAREPQVGGPGPQWTAYQWLLTLTAHTERHLAQIAEIQASPGYPR